MQIMLDQSPDVLDEKSERFGFDFWQLRTPLTRYRLSGRPYGLDNGMFTGVLHPSWRRLVEEAEESRPVFVAVPDIVGDAQRTLELWEHFNHQLHGLPKAFVLQDGIERITIPWRWISAVFVGGSDAFKVSPAAFAAARTAKIMGKWVHVGRVNEPRRVSAWRGLADSIDGSGISRYDHMLREVVDAVRGDEKQAPLFESIKDECA